MARADRRRACRRRCRPPRPPRHPPRRAVPDADPALWVVSDADTTIYLFGTFHALDGRTPGSTTRSATAFDASDELVLETVVPEVRPATRSGAAIAGGRTLGRSAPLGARSSPRPGWRSSAGRAQGMTVEQWRRHRPSPRRRSRRQAGRRAWRASSSSSACSAACPASRRGAAAGGASGSRARWQSVDRRWASMQAAWKRGDTDIFATMLDQMRAKSPDSLPDAVHRAQRQLGRLDRQPAADSPARCSSPSAPAISPARTASRPSSPSAASLSPHQLDRRVGRRSCQIPRASRPIGARLPSHGHPWRRGGAFCI